jgi:hypothetical protein
VRVQIIHVLLACRYAVLYWEMRESLFVVTRGLDSLLLNLLASVISVMAICLRQVAADTPPDSPTAFSVACNYMEVSRDTDFARIDSSYRAVPLGLLSGEGVGCPSSSLCVLQRALQSKQKSGEHRSYAYMREEANHVWGLS